MDKGELTLLLPPSQMDFCVISNCSALIYHSRSFSASIFMTFFFFWWNMSLFHLAYSNVISCHLRRLKKYCPSNIIKAVRADALLYSYPIRLWKNVHVENLSHTSLVEIVLPKEKLLSYRALAFTVIPLGEKVHHFSAHNGNSISYTGLL